MDEWQEWEAFFALEPFGAPAEFWRAGLIAATLHNVNRTKDSQPMLKAEDLMPETLTGKKAGKRRMNQAQISQTLRRLAGGGRP